LSACAPRLDHDLSPTYAIAEVGVFVMEAARQPILQGLTEFTRKLALDAQRRKPAVAAKQRDSLCLAHNYYMLAVNGNAQPVCILVGCVAKKTFERIAHNGAISVLSHLLRYLERRYLGHIDHIVNPNLDGRRRNAGKVIDRKVAEWMCCRGHQVHNKEQYKTDQP
jgi:hypothetical protein